MAKRGECFFDNKGEMHSTAEQASVSDLCSVLGKIGNGEGLTPGIAKLILDHRAEISQIFAEHDEMQSKPASKPSPPPSRPASPPPAEPAERVIREVSNTAVNSAQADR